MAGKSRSGDSSDAWVLDVLLSEGAAVSYLEDTYQIRRMPAGILHLPSGHVVAADPGTVRGDEPAFAATVAPGSYAVVVVNLCETGSEAVSFTAGLHLMISDEPVDRWEPARFANDAPEADGAADDGSVYGYAVDCGVAAFMDALAVPALAALDADDRERVVFSEGKPYDLDRHAGLNVIVSDSGGDGFYGVWVGRAADGSVAGFITEFQVIGFDSWIE